MPRKILSPEQIEHRFESLIAKKPTGCWLWSGPMRGPRGLFCFNGVQILAHEWAYMAYVGDYPSSSVTVWKCGNSLCVNPKHLDVKPFGYWAKGSKTMPKMRGSGGKGPYKRV